MPKESLTLDVATKLSKNFCNSGLVTAFGSTGLAFARKTVIPQITAVSYDNSVPLPSNALCILEITRFIPLAPERKRKPKSMSRDACGIKSKRSQLSSTRLFTLQTWLFPLDNRCYNGSSIVRPYVTQVGCSNGSLIFRSDCSCSVSKIITYLRMSKHLLLSVFTGKHLYSR